MKVFLKRVIFILLIIISLSYLVSIISLWSLRRSSFYKPSFLVNSVQNTQFDYVIIGASTGLTTLNSKIIDSINKTSGINLSMDDTKLPSQYLILQHFLEQGKTTKVCVLAPNASNFNSKINSLSTNDYRFLPYINQDYVCNYFDSFSDSEAHYLKWSKWLPILGVSYYNSELFYPSIVSAFKPRQRNRFDALGNYTYPLNTREDQLIKEITTRELKFINPYLLKIKSLCEQNGIKLVCYISPKASEHYYIDAPKFKVVNHSNLLDNTKYFYDDLHVNIKGRNISSIAFAKELITCFN